MARTLRWRIIAVGAAVALAAGCGSEDGGDAEAGVSDPDTIVLGLVPSDNVDKLVENAEGLGSLLEAEIGMPVETFVSDDYAGLRTAMQTGQAHVGMFGPVGLAQAVDQAGAEAVLQSIRFGGSTYNTQWFTNNPERYCEDEPVTIDFEREDDDGEVISTHPMSYCNGAEAYIARLGEDSQEGPVGEEALSRIPDGTTISFVDELSASGYFYPATQLREAGVEYEQQFAGDHDNSVRNVYNGDFEVGVSFDDARPGQVDDLADIGERVTVFAMSPEIPNDGVALSGDLSDDLKARITEAFLAISDTDEGVKQLQATYEIDGLVPAELDALDAARQVALNFGDR